MKNEEKKLTLDELGYEARFESDRKKFESDNFVVARVTSEQRGAYKVKNTDGEYSAKITGKMRFLAHCMEDYPAVGDWVMIERGGKGQAVIHGLLPRKTILKRKFGDKDRKGEKNETQVLAANIDLAFIIQSVGRDLSLNRYERYFAIARSGQVEPAVILNKVDLLTKEELNLKLEEIKARLERVPVFATSIKTGQGIAELKNSIQKGKTYCFLGSSGVGKSSLINSLLGTDFIKTGDVGVHSNRGRHVTTSRQMYFLPTGGIVIDNPGVREAGMSDNALGVENTFDDITALSFKCRFADCTHAHEPGCAVLAAVRSGTLDEKKYGNYLTLQKETSHNENSKLQKRNKARQFGKFLNKAKKKFREVGFKDY